jgi:hypothetical protein
MAISTRNTELSQRALTLMREVSLMSLDLFEEVDPVVFLRLDVPFATAGLDGLPTGGRQTTV